MQSSLSLLMTSYKRKIFIAEAIESVLVSTYTNFELIIVDGSNDWTVEIARLYAAKDSRIKLYVNEKNLGDYPNRNQAFNFIKIKSQFLRLIFVRNKWISNHYSPVMIFLLFITKKCKQLYLNRSLFASNIIIIIKQYNYLWKRS